jgi:hypothetical protein
MLVVVVLVVVPVPVHTRRILDAAAAARKA